MPRIRLGGLALGVAALAACSDSQSPDDSRTPPSDNSATLLPTLPSARVDAAFQAGDFAITLRFVNTPTASQQAEFDAAAAKWQGIITGDVPSVTGTIPKKACGPQFKTPEFTGSIDDILIDVLLQDIDGPGGILGAAGPCGIRGADFLSFYGIMFFDTADIDRFLGLGLFDEIVVHEMGHVLGFGTLWEFGRDLLDGTGGPDPRFTGPLAITAYDRLGGEGTVPVEGNEFGPGTADGHWDEATFFNELMTGFLNSSASANILSDLSAAAMADLGYDANVHAGDPYKLPATDPAVAAEQRAAVGGFDLRRAEILIKPTMVVR